MSKLEELRRFPDRTRTLLAFLEDPVAVITLEQNIVYLNPAFARRFRCTWEGALGRPIGEVLPRPIITRILQHLEGLEASSPPRHFWAKSEQESFRLSLVPVKARGRLIGAVVSLWDATVEAEIKQMNVALFLALLEDMANPVANLGRHLATPGDRPPRSANLEPTLRQEAARIQESLTRFQDFAEILFGQVVPARVPFQPLRLLALARKTLTASAKGRKVFLDEAPTRDLPEVLGDPAYLNRILGLVVDYMIKRVGRGELVIMAVDLLSLPESATLLVYSITGTGWVASPQFLRGMTGRMQDLYLGKDDEEKRQLLRLLMARRLIQAMDGTFTLAAHEKVGTTFSIAIPAAIHSVNPTPDAEVGSNSTSSR